MSLLLLCCSRTTTYLLTNWWSQIVKHLMNEFWNKNLQSEYCNTYSSRASKILHLPCHTQNYPPIPKILLPPHFNKAELNVNFWSFHLFYQGRSNAIAKLLSLFFFLLLCNSYLRNHFSIWIESFFPCYLNSSATPFYLRMQLAMQSAEQIQILNKAVQGWVISGLKILHITVFPGVETLLSLLHTRASSQ